MERVFGIDLGTTYSCIAYIDEYGKATVLKNSEGDHTTPSVVYVESEDNIIVGKEAKRSAELEPDRTIQFIKRKMGKEDDVKEIDGVQHHAPEISAWILKKLVNDANDELIQTGVIEEGEEIEDVVITCPAYFGANERAATRLAGEMAGLNVLNIINEPTAAAISYGVSGSDRDETVLVYDLGGGTFDITVMNISGSRITVICTGGDDQLGGKDWDDCLKNYVILRYEEEYGEDLSEEPEMVARLYNDAEEWKKSLSAREKVNISVNTPAGKLREELTRKKFEELTSHLLGRTRNLLDDVLATAAKQGYPLRKIDKVLLVGGSSRMPQVSAMLETEYGVRPSLTDPDEAVAKGAAIFAGNEKQFNDFVLDEAKASGQAVEDILEENCRTGALDKKFALTSGGTGNRLMISNVLSRTYGIASLYDGGELRICNLLMINEKLPASKTEHFQTSSNGQSEIKIDVYENRSIEEWIDIEDREPLTTVYLRLKRPVPRYTPVDISLSLDNAGLMHIRAVELENGSELDTSFQLSNQMSEGELRNAVSRISSINIE